MSETEKKKVIIFDDDDDILSICTYILEDHGWKVYTYDNCNDVTGKVANIMPDVILMDNWIPDTGGIEATQALKADAMLKSIPVVYFSANSDIQSLAKTAGAESYIAKPFDINDLERVINEAVK